MPVFQLTDQFVFPHPSLSREDGLLAIDGDLSVERLLLAYHNGIFPWYNFDEPILWWSPDPRLILKVNDFKASKSLKKKAISGQFEVRFDTVFEQVIKNCAQVKRHGVDSTWIVPEMIKAYILLHRYGFAHSVETFYENQLVGGLYGVVVGGVFSGESMFHKMADTSKIAFYHLVNKMQDLNMDFIDAQTESNHLKSLGASCISREVFLKMLQDSIENHPQKIKWPRGVL